jgi:hypothetical protein
MSNRLRSEMVCRLRAKGLDIAVLATDFEANPGRVLVEVPDIRLGPSVEAPANCGRLAN